ncbi:unnamed protein product [Prunus armeniaca]
MKTLKNSNNRRAAFKASEKLMLLQTGQQQHATTRSHKLTTQIARASKWFKLWTLSRAEKVSIISSNVLVLFGSPLCELRWAGTHRGCQNSYPI